MGKFTKPKRQGGIGIGDLEGFNLALLAKWWWRIKEEPDQLWVRVVAAIHGPNKGLKIIPIKQSISGWWKDIANVDADLKKMGICVNEKLKVEIGDGKGILFWHDNWTGLGSLKNVFPHAYRISANKNELVYSCVTNARSTSLWSWSWLKNPNSDAEWVEVGNMMRILQNINLKGCKDKWHWVNDDGQKFSTKSIRWEMAQKVVVPSDCGPFRWNSWAPKKVNYLV
ncbi:hypothetical protein Hanom_Chr01g00068771 [Helianthus anomalus]